MRFVRRLAPPLILLALALPGARPATADMVEDCEQLDNPTITVEGCTEAINSGQWSGADIAWAYYNRASARGRLGQVQQSVADFDEAISRNPGFGPAYLGRASAVYRLGGYQQALVDFSEAIERDPSLFAAYFGRGNTYYRLREYQKALDDFDEAIKLNRNFGEAYANRGAARCRLGIVEGSVTDRVRAMELRAISARDQQTRLKEAGYYKGAIDGLFGPGSRRALTAWTKDGCP